LRPRGRESIWKRKIKSVMSPRALAVDKPERKEKPDESDFFPESRRRSLISRNEEKRKRERPLL
jgi:hypothetical protein